jgi:hypothetical protein
MDKQIRDSDFVVMVCTETYYQRVMGEEQSGKGLGVRWEGHLIYGEIYRAGTMNTKFIPVLFGGGDRSHIRTFPLRRATRTILLLVLHAVTKIYTAALRISPAPSNRN